MSMVALLNARMSSSMSARRAPSRCAREGHAACQCSGAGGQSLSRSRPDIGPQAAQHSRAGSTAQKAGGMRTLVEPLTAPLCSEGR